MMRILPTQVVDVQRDQGVIDEALEELVREIDVESADHRPCERYVEFEPRPPGEIDHDARQRLVERNVGVAIARQARLVAQRLLDRLPKSDADILDGVMAHRCAGRPWRRREVHRAVARDLVEHVIEKRHAGDDVGMAAAVEIHADDDRRLAGDALDPRGTRGPGGSV